MKCVEVYKELYHQEPFDVAFCPYRISPLGAHIDHQYGKINGLAIDKGIHMPEVRVDLYNVNGKILFGEMTFFHWSGLMPFEPEEWDYKFGSWWQRICGTASMKIFRRPCRNISLKNGICRKKKMWYPVHLY